MTRVEWLEPMLPSQAMELSPVGQSRLCARARQEVLQRTASGTYVYPPGALLLAWSVGTLDEYPRASIGIVVLLTVIVLVRAVLCRQALADTTRASLAGKAHLLLGVVSVIVFSSGVGAAYLVRGGDAAATTGYVGLAAIASGVVMAASVQRRLATIWMLATMVPGIAALMLHGDAIARVLLVMYALYLPILFRMIGKNYGAWWHARVAAARLDEQSHELARMSRHAGMAENATNVLHDVGNTLNSVKTSADLLVHAGELHPASDLERFAALFEAHRDELPAFFAAEGSKVLRFVAALVTAAREHASTSTAEASRLQVNVRHIEAIVRRQQEVAREIGTREPCGVAELVDDAVGLSRAAWAEVRVEIDEVVRTSAGVAVDRPRALQILVNLLENACDANAEHGTSAIVVRAREDADAVVIEVVDHGRGIAPEMADRIFTRGFTTKPHGHGFGLHGSFSLAQAMGGALSFESAGVGHGAVFRLRLPGVGALAA